MKTRYYVCGIGYDENDRITDHEQNFGDFDTLDEARELFTKLESVDADSFFTNAPQIYQLLIQLEECEEDDNEINCIDVIDEMYVFNTKANITNK